jgi:hypothetical protein
MLGRVPIGVDRQKDSVWGKICSYGFHNSKTGCPSDITGYLSRSHLKNIGTANTVKVEIQKTILTVSERRSF